MYNANIKLVARCPAASRHTGTFNILSIRLTPRLQQPPWLPLNWTKNFYNAPKTFQLYSTKYPALIQKIVPVLIWFKCRWYCYVPLKDISAGVTWNHFKNKFYPKSNGSRNSEAFCICRLNKFIRWVVRPVIIFWNNLLPNV